MEITFNISQKNWSDSFIDSLVNVESFNKLCGEVNTGAKGISSSTCNIPRNRFAFHQADKAKVFVEKRQRRGYIQIAFIF
jgi:hypothetical protein